jgi:hypothetical protein
MNDHAKRWVDQTRVRNSGPLSGVAIAVAAILTSGSLAMPGKPFAAEPTSEQRTKMTNHKYVGMWVTLDGRIRHELLPNNRYDEARGNRTSAYQGRYEIRGTHIDYWDDTGFTADGTFVSDDELHHAGMILRREK